MNAQLALVLANQLVTADQYGDRDRIQWWAAQAATTPTKH